MLQEWKLLHAEKTGRQISLVGRSMHKFIKLQDNVVI